MARPSGVVYEKRAPYKSPSAFLLVFAVGTLAALFYLSSQRCLYSLQGDAYCGDFTLNPLTVPLVAIFPGIFFLWLYRQDRFESEPLALMFLLFGLGASSTFLAFFLNNSLHLPAYFAGFVEEPCKILGLTYLVLHKEYGKEFNGPMDGLVWGAAAGAGFATVENVFYLMVPILYGSLFPGDPMVAAIYNRQAIDRNIAGLGHMIYTGIVAWWLGMAKARRGSNNLFDLIPGLSISISMHNMYNFLTESLGPVWFLPLAFYSVFFIKAVREAHREELSWGYRAGYAPEEHYKDLK